jgi:hypothetical protein
MHQSTFPVLALLLCGAAATQTPNALKVQRIVLYKHGIGFFERQGVVQGDADVALTFSTAQMKDVLKSLFVVDLDGGQIATVHYDSKDPIQKQLEDILFRVPDASALTQFLAQLRGARVSVHVGGQATEGQVLGIEPITTRVEQGTITRHRLVLMTGAGEIRTVELQEASQVDILDEVVRRDLGRLMDIYAKARYADRKTVSVRATGQGERRVRAGYILETPIWKTSYRLLLEPGQPPRLQGWAIVENRTDEDWQEVELSFVAGSPISFVLDLYTSYYPKRPVLDLGVAAATGADDFERAKTAAPAPPAARARRGLVAEKAEAEPAADAGTLGELLEQSTAPLTEGVAIGDLFSYRAKGPVTIKQGQAALVPILFERLEQAAKTLHYDQAVSPHPAHAVRLVNSTQLTLEKGPVTVFEGSACLGEGLLQRTLKPGMNDMLRYAFEPAVEIEPRGEQRASPVIRGTVANGLLTLTYTQVHERIYKIRNKSGRDHSLYLDVQKLGGDFRLVEPAKAFEELPNVWRFQLELAKDGETQFTVREEMPVTSQISIVEQDPSTIRFHLQQKYLDDAARNLLGQIVALLDQRASVERQLQQNAADRQQELGDQENLRQNIQALRDVSAPEQRKLRDEYLNRLTESMKRVDALDARTRELRTERERVEQEIRRVVTG